MNVLTKFKINNLKQELEENRVSQTRHKDIINFFTKILGEGEYYCISPNNREGKELIKVENGTRLLKKYDTEWLDRAINEIQKSDEYYDKESKLQWYFDTKQGYVEHNNKIDNLSQDEKTLIENLQNKLGFTIKRFKFGYRGVPTELTPVIVTIQGKYFMALEQEPEVRTAYEFEHRQDMLSYYILAKDIDSIV